MGPASVKGYYKIHKNHNSCTQVLARMGHVNPTPRLQRFIDMGFSVEETRMALAACNDDEARALELLLERRRARERAPVAAFISDQLQEMRSWPEFFERFMWPEHLYDRVRTNLFYCESPRPDLNPQPSPAPPAQL